jgi:hypothetical protein
MSTSFLYQRLVKNASGCAGTLSEPQGTPEPRFALQGTVNWMRALAILVTDSGIDWPSMDAFYAVHVTRAVTLSQPAVNTAFEQLLMSLHHLASLQAMVRAKSDHDFARIAVMAWYYGIYCAASAMVAAKDGSLQDDHSSTANQWDHQIAASGLIPRPFNFRLTTMVKKDAASQIVMIRNGSRFDINSRPICVNDAIGACASYLSGTREYRESQITDELKNGEMKKLNLSDFRTSRAKQLRDARLGARSLGFVHQAFRYRGKANYRDALFLTYEAQVGNVLDGFIADTVTVLRAFLTAAGAFCSHRLSGADWRAFVTDLNQHLTLAVMPRDVLS